MQLQLRPLLNEIEGREGLQFKKQKLSDSVATTTANDAGANTGDDGGGVGEASSSGACAIRVSGYPNHIMTKLQHSLNNYNLLEEGQETNNKENHENTTTTSTTILQRLQTGNHGVRYQITFGISVKDVKLLNLEDGPKESGRCYGRGRKRIIIGVVIDVGGCRS